MSITYKHRMSKLWFDRYFFMKLCAEMLFRFQWHIENSSQELGLGPGFFSLSPLIMSEAKITPCLKLIRIILET